MNRGLGWLALTLVFLAASHAPSQAQVTLGSVPSNPPAQYVGTAIDQICPRLGAARPTLNPAQLDLSDRCNEMKNPFALGVAVLPEVLTDVTSTQSPAQGRFAVDARATQFRPLLIRLDTLRTGRASLDGLAASADTLGGRLGAFVNGIGNFGSRDSTSTEAGFDFHSVGTIAGVDYRFTDNFVGGAAFSYLRTESDISFGLGSVDSNTYGGSLYGTYYVGPLYVDMLGGFSWHDYDVTRRINYGPGLSATVVDRTATGDTGGWQYNFALGAGYDFRPGAWTVTPYARVEYAHLDIDGYKEQGAFGLNLDVKGQTVESLVTALGTRVSYAVNTSIGVFMPTVHADWRHEALNGRRNIKAQFLNDPSNTIFFIPTDDPDRDYFALGAGVSATFRKGLAAFLEYESLVGLRDVTNHNFTAGIRLEF